MSEYTIYWILLIEYFSVYFCIFVQFTIMYIGRRGIMSDYEKDDELRRKYGEVMDSIADDIRQINVNKSERLFLTKKLMIFPKYRRYF